MKIDTYDLGLIQLKQLRLRYPNLTIGLVGTIDGEANFSIHHGARLIGFRTWSNRDSTALTNNR